MKTIAIVGGILLALWMFICWCLLRVCSIQLEDDER
jgi:hypothetical protein